MATFCSATAALLLLQFHVSQRQQQQECIRQKTSDVGTLSKNNGRRKYDGAYGATPPPLSYLSTIKWNDRGNVAPFWATLFPICQCAGRRGRTATQVDTRLNDCAGYPSHLTTPKRLKPVGGIDDPGAAYTASTPPIRSPLSSWQPHLTSFQVLHRCCRNIFKSPTIFNNHKGIAKKKREREREREKKEE